MKGIAFKLWIGMMSLVIFVIILLWLFQIVFLDRFYKEIRISDIEKDGYSIIQQLDNHNRSEVLNQLDKFAYNNNLTAELIDKQYKTVYSTNTSMQMMMRHHLKQKLIDSTLMGEIDSIEMIHPRFNSEFMMIGIPVRISGKVENALIITLPVAPVSETVSILKKQLFFITFILLGTAFIFAFILSRTFTKPIRDITNVSLEMASGNLSARVKENRKDEIGKLARTINHMGDELLKVEELRKDLIANVSHELRTPLSLIKGYAETIRDISGECKKEREKQLAIMIEESDRLSKIVEDMLSLSQIQAGYMSLEISPFSLNELLKRISKRYEMLSKKTDIDLQIETQKEHIVKADENRIEQVLYNFINNAFNHSKKGDIVKVKVFNKQDFVRVEVIDYGEGIPQDELPYIWDRFYKVDQARKRNVVGTGLGLSIVKSILKAHQFNFGAESAVGRGTTFWFETKTIE